MVWVHVVAGSNPATPTKKKRLDNEVQICNNGSCEVERERILMIGASPSAGGAGAARPPRERETFI